MAIPPQNAQYRRDRPLAGSDTRNSRRAGSARPQLATEQPATAGHSVDVLLRIYAKCIDGQDAIAKRRISEALGENSAALPPAPPAAGDDQDGGPGQPPG